MGKQFSIILIVIVVAAGGTYWWWQNQEMGPQEVGTVMEDGVAEEDSDTSAPLSAAVSYDGTGFSPSSVTIKRGGTVTWTNTGSGGMWAASAQHPTHTVYAGTSLQEHCSSGDTDAFDQCADGDSYSFTFNKAGTWRYHDHLNASVFGSVVVE